MRQSTFSPCPWRTRVRSIVSLGLGVLVFAHCLTQSASAAITVVQNKGKLTIIGDNVASDTITVDDDGNGGTMVNATGPYFGITSIVIDGRGGDEVINVRRQILLGALEIKLGASGASGVTITGTGVHGKTTITGQTGYESVQITQCSFSDDVKFESGEGLSDFRLDSVGAFDVTFKSGRDAAIFTSTNANIVGKLAVTTSDGIDYVGIGNSAIAVAEIKTGNNDDEVDCGAESDFGTLKIEAGSGVNEVYVVMGCEVGGDLRLKTEEGFDTIRLGGGLVVGGKLTVETGAGVDSFGLDSAEIGTASIKTGNDSDQCTLNGVLIGTSLTIESEGGVDRVELVGSRIGGATSIKLGNLSDGLYLDANTFDGTAKFDGGSGDADDVFRSNSNSFQFGATFPNFEVFL